tara:strand:- start:1639 stop:2433 length:795 start_codon:yes stop_codon:yes gene_type:complete
MSDPVISPDGKSMWNGSEWIPVADTNQGTIVQDSVVMGDIHSTTNHYHANSLKCNVCGAKGSISILSCSGLSCENTFCNYCQDSRYEKLCGICVELEISKLHEDERRTEMERIQKEEIKRNSILLDLEEKRKRWDLERRLAKTLSARMVKTRYFSFPLIYLLLLYITFLISDFENTGDLVLFGMMQFALSLICYNLSISFNRKNLKYVFVGKSPIRAVLIASSPFLGLLFTIPFFLNETSPQLAWIIWGTLLSSIYLSVKVVID